MSSREFLIAGNWKMYKTVAESRQFVADLEKEERLFAHGVEVAIFAPFTSLPALRETARRVRIGAQNLHQEKEGAFTGEISGPMLAGLAEYVLIGHSERRCIFHETDQLINRKIVAALSFGLKPVLCIGETLAEREKGETFVRLQVQLEKGLEHLPPEQVRRLMFAYEPVWAIGTGRNATAAQAQEAQRFIRESLEAYGGAEMRPVILYGGSVKPENSAELLGQPDISGLLIGGASLKLDSFSAIIQSAEKVQNP